MNEDQFKRLETRIEQLEKDLKNFILEREVIAMRWVVGIQVTYFFGTLAAVWFLITHH